MLTTIKNEYDMRFHIEELLTIGMLTILNIMIFLRTNLSGEAGVLFGINTALIVMVVIIARQYIKNTSAALGRFRDLYPVVLCLLIFFEHHFLVPLINPHDIDNFLIQIDRYLFLGNDPSVLFESFTYPIITEILQIAYTTFYLMPLTICGVLYFKGQKIGFHIIATAILLGYYTSYLGYYLCPAIGPRFTLSELQNFPLTGMLAYDFIRSTLDTFEGVTRDCFPSGHTLISALAAMMAYKYRKSAFRGYTLWATLIIIATVYLRYHYVVDVIAGFIIAYLIYRVNPYLVRKYIFLMDKSKENSFLEDAQTSSL